MAASEVIHFPLCVQLNRGATLQADTFRESTASSPDPPPHLPDLLPARPGGTVLSADAGELSV
jgi:hypothetical protein